MSAHQKEEIKRRMSQGAVAREVQKLSTSDIPQPRGANGLPPISPSSNASTSSFSSVNDYKNLVASMVEEKPDYFKASVMVRSQSSSSNTSR